MTSELIQKRMDKILDSLTDEEIKALKEEVDRIRI